MHLWSQHGFIYWNGAHRRTPADRRSNCGARTISVLFELNANYIGSSLMILATECLEIHEQAIGFVVSRSILLFRGILNADLLKILEKRQVRVVACIFGFFRVSMKILRYNYFGNIYCQFFCIALINDLNHSICSDNEKRNLILHIVST